MKKTSLYLIAAGALWALTGPAFQMLAKANFTRLSAVGVRLLVATIGMLAVCLIRRINFRRISLRDLMYCACAGILGYAMFNFTYFNTISLTSLSVAVSLMYTSPAFVILLSRIFYKEPVTKTKLAALVITVIGAALVTGAASQAGTINWQGLAMGLATGFGYALYNLFSKAPLSRNPSELVNFYTLMFGMLFIFVLEPPTRFIPLLNTTSAVLPALALGIVCCLLPSLFFTKGLAATDPGLASILVSFELPVAAVIGFISGDPVRFWQVVGLILLLFAIVIVNYNPRRKVPD